MNKYNARRVSIDSITYASRREANRHQELLWLQRAGEIHDIELQPRYPRVVNGVKVCVYVADFRYVEVATGRTIVEDAKGYRTPVFRLKSKLMAACYGITIREVYSEKRTGHVVGSGPAGPLRESVKTVDTIGT